MLDFSNYCATVIVHEHKNVIGTRISFNEKLVKQIMTNDGIRKTKVNIQTCKQELIDFVKSGLSNEWKLFHEINGDFGFKQIL